MVKTIQKIDDNRAWITYAEIRRLKQQTEGNMLRIGARLDRFITNKYYRDMDYDSFESFLADPEIDIQPRMAYRMIRIHREFIVGYCNELQLEVDNGDYIEVLEDKDPGYIKLLTATGVSKLDKIASYVTSDTRIPLLNTASTTSRSDLHAYLTNTEPEYTETWRITLQDARTLCTKLAKDHSAPYEVREYANEFVSQTKPALMTQSTL
jgi:hypothetical protein